MHSKVPGNGFQYGKLAKNPYSTAVYDLGAKRPTYRIPHREGLKQMFGGTAADALRRRR
jgi:hypothetical protein